MVFGTAIKYCGDSWEFENLLFCEHGYTHDLLNSWSKTSPSFSELPFQVQLPFGYYLTRVATSFKNLDTFYSYENIEAIADLIEETF